MVTAFVLKHPYPFKCAFTICNDCDYITREAFETLHRFLNTDQKTKLGKGLGLPIADSMFMYCERPGVMSYFTGTTENPSSESGFLRDAVAEGWIDSLHGYGDFVNKNSFARDMARKALEELDRKDIRLDVWIDHGSSDNRQNLNGPGVFSRGGNPKSSAYHTDLLKDYGMVFVAGYNSDLIGQDGRKRYLAKPLRQPGVPAPLLKRIHGRLYRSNLLSKIRCKDRRLFWSFCRARSGVLRPDASTLAHQISRETVKKLVDSKGTMILYQHLGAVRGKANPFPYLDSQAIEALEHMADQYRNGSIWVAPTSKLLRFTRVRESLRLECHERNDELVIEIFETGNETGGFALKDLSHISIRVRGFRGDKLVLKYGSHRFKKKEYRVFEDDGTVIRLHPFSHQ